MEQLFVGVSEGDFVSDFRSTSQNDGISFSRRLLILPYKNMEGRQSCGLLCGLGLGGLGFRV